MAIDREINSRVQAYQGNPGALQKRYAASKELIDLLALQRLKSQKDDAARQIQMEMQQMPGTIKAQREAELMGQNVQELAKRTGDTMRSMGMKKKMAAQNKAMGKRAQGLAALTGNPMGQQNRPQQPLRMQAGGIVGFNNGNLVGTKDAKVRRQIQSLINQGLSDEQIKAEVQKLGLLPQAADRVIKMVREQQREDMSAEPKTRPIDLPSSDPTLATQGSQPPPKSTMQRPTDTSEDIQRDLAESRKALKGLGISEKDLVRVKNGTPEPTGTPNQFPELTDAEGNKKPATQLVTEMGELQAPKIDTSKAADQGLALAAKYGMGPDQLKDPEQYRKDVRDDEADFFRRDDKRKAYQAMIDERKGLEAIQEDPDKLRQERLMARMIGGSRGLGRAAAAGERTRASQEERARGNIDKRFEMLKELENQDMQVAQYASAAGRDALKEASAMRRVAFDAVSRMRNQDVQRIVEEARMEYNSNKDNVKNLLDAAVADGTEALRLAIQEGNDLQRGMAILEDLVARKQAALSELRENIDKSLNVQKAQNTLANSNSKPEEREKAQRILDRADREFAIKSQEMFEASGANELEADIRRRLGLSAPSQTRFNTKYTAPEDFEGWGSEVKVTK